MALKITDEETCAFIKELADLTGETFEEVVRKSVSERLDTITKGKKSLLTIGQECATRLKKSATSIDVDDLYDDNGLPK